MATTFLEGEKYVSIASVSPVVKGLYRQFSNSSEAIDDSFETTYKKNMRDALQKRFPHVLSDHDGDGEVASSSMWSNSARLAFDKATFLHPSYKLQYLLRRRGLTVSVLCSYQSSNNIHIAY